MIKLKNSGRATDAGAYDHVQGNGKLTGTGVALEMVRSYAQIMAILARTDFGVQASARSSLIALNCTKARIVSGSGMPGRVHSASSPLVKNSITPTSNTCCQKVWFATTVRTLRTSMLMRSLLRNPRSMWTAPSNRVSRSECALKYQ